MTAEADRQIAPEGINAPQSKCRGPALANGNVTKDMVRMFVVRSEVVRIGGFTNVRDEIGTLSM